MGPSTDPTAAVAAWAASGAMGLTGRADGPALGPPAGLVPGLVATGARLGLPAGEVLALLGERAALAGLSRHGTASCGLATRLLPTADGWIALTLARDEDVDLLPAWLGALVEPGEDPWPAVAEIAALVPTTHLLAAADGLGLPLAALGEAAADPGEPGRPPVVEVEVPGPAVAPRPDLDGLTVVDLTSLWAGPLAGALLVDLGAEVVKVESTRRPDGARSGPAPLFDLLNAGKRSVALDLAEPGGRAALADLVRSADVVLEGSRPRALRALGIEAETVLAGAGPAGGPRVWASITAHGRAGASGMRIGFGDDAAVAGGLVAWEGDQARFCADAVADPATGLVTAAAVLDAVARDGRWLLDVGLSAVAAHLAGPTLAVPEGTEPAPPRARPSRGAGPDLGTDTAAVLGALR